MGAQEAVSRADVATMVSRLERLPFTKYQATIFSIIATAWFFDSIDLGAITFLLSPIKAEFHLDSLTTGILSASSFLGMFFGASLSGMLADRIGRMTVFQWSMVLWGAGSVLCGFSYNLNTLILSRILVGLGMGMEFPVAQAIAAEITPKNHRGRYTAFLEGFWPLGFIAAGLITVVLLPAYGWRFVFLAEGIPALFVLVVRRSIPESPRWLLEKGRVAEAERVMTAIEHRVAASLRKPLPEPELIELSETLSTSNTPFRELWSASYYGRTIMAWTMWFFALLGYYGLTTWLGALLVQSGFTIIKSTYYIVAITALGGIPGFIAAASAIEPIGRKPVTVASLTGAAIFAYLYGTASTLHTVIGFGIGMQFFLFAMWSALYAYTPELYPTRARATGAGWASAIGRIGSLIGPIVVGIILPKSGQAGVFALGAGAFAIAAAIVLVMGIETKGRLLEEVSR